MIKIVIIEDEEFIRRGMVITTPWNDFDCQIVGEASNGLEGAKLIKKLKPDIVITDIRMPIMDGLQMIKNLLDFSDTEYIIVSGYDDFKYAQQAIKLGVKDYLLKPIDDIEFYTTLNKVIQNVKLKKGKNEALEYKIFKEFTVKSNYDGRIKYIIEATEYIKANYSKDITLKEVAENLYISESYLSRLFKTYTSYTFIEYLTKYRMKIAINLLKDHRIKVYEVSELVGYNDPKYFSVIFKKYVGTTPMEFKYSLA